MLFATAGCGAPGGKPAPEVVPVDGTIMYNGQPVQGATVSFYNEKAPQVASGVTDAEGKFRLSMLAANDGAMPGDNIVTVTKVEGGAAPTTTADPSTMDPAALTQGYTDQLQGTTPQGPKHLIPAKYANQATSGVTKTVTKEGPNTFVIQLTD